MALLKTAFNTLLTGTSYYITHLDRIRNQQLVQPHPPTFDFLCSDHLPKGGYWPTNHDLPFNISLILHN